MNNEDWKKRLVIEYQDLSIKIQKLGDYLSKRSEELLQQKNEISDYDMDLFCIMFRQLTFMNKYRDCLLIRADMLKINLKGDPEDEE